MKKIIRRIIEWRNAFDRRLCRHLESLSPKARLITVFVMFSLFAVGCLVMLGTAIHDFGKGKVQMRMEHIKRLELPSDEHPVIHYDYGTEQPDCETEAGMMPAENLAAYETE